jgi:hypothetical protein
MIEPGQSRMKPGQEGEYNTGRRLKQNTSTGPSDRPACGPRNTFDRRKTKARSVFFYFDPSKKTFSINRSSGKLFSYLDLRKGALCVLQGINLTGVLPVHMDRVMPRWIAGRQ